MLPGTVSESALLCLVLGPQSFAHTGTALTSSFFMLDSLTCCLLLDCCFCILSCFITCSWHITSPGGCPVDAVSQLTCIFGAAGSSSRAGPTADGHALPRFPLFCRHDAAACQRSSRLSTAPAQSWRRPQLHGPTTIFRSLTPHAPFRLHPHGSQHDGNY